MAQEYANPVDLQYLELLKDILQNGYAKGDRTGTGTTSVFGRVFRHRMVDGFPLLTSKRMYTKGIITELLWFLGAHLAIPAEAPGSERNYVDLGRTNIRYLLDNKCYIWVGDAYKKYLSVDEYAIAEQGFGVINGRAFTFPHPHRHYTKEEFIEAVKNDDDFAKAYGDLGPIYGQQWRSFGPDVFERAEYEQFCTPEFMSQDEMLDKVIEGACEVTKFNDKIGRNIGGYDQIYTLINDLKNNPDSRRLMVTAWNPLDLEAATLPPCHYGFQCYTRELSDEERSVYVTDQHRLNYADYIEQCKKYNLEQLNLLDHCTPKRELSLSWNQRSVDTPLGLPFNIASYGFLLEMLAQQVNMIPGELIGYLGDTHIYNNQLEGVQEQLANPTFKLPTLKLNKARYIETYELKDFVIEGYESAGVVNYPLSN